MSETSVLLNVNAFLKLLLLFQCWATIWRISKIRTSSFRALGDYTKQLLIHKTGLFVRSQSYLCLILLAWVSLKILCATTPGWFLYLMIFMFRINFFDKIEVQIITRHSFPNYNFVEPSCSLWWDLYQRARKVNGAFCIHLTPKRQKLWGMRSFYFAIYWNR